MPKMRDFFFGKPPFEFLIRHLVEDEEFLADIRRIISVDEDSFSRLAVGLNNAAVFLDRTTLIDFTDQVIGAGDESRALASSIYKIAGVLHAADKPADEAMEEFASVIQEKADALPEGERKIAIERLRAMVAEPVGFARQWKARDLINAIGSELDGIQIICDIRPIFDQRKDRIEGLVPLTILRLDYTLPDQSSAVAEIRLTEKQLEEFELKLATAKGKLRSIKELAARQALPIPRTKATEED